MNKRRFFASVWRANAIIILLAGLLSCGVLLIGGAAILRDAFRPRQVSNVVNVAPEQAGSDRTRLGTFSRVEGTDVFRAPLHIEQEYELGVSSKETTAIQNYLFYDPGTGGSYWLRTGAPALIAATHELPERDFTESLPVRAVIYEIVEKDTNGDQRLTPEDEKLIAVSDPGGKRLSTLVNGIAEVHAADITTGNGALVLYSASGKLRALVVDVASQKIVRSSVVGGPTPGGSRLP